MNKIKVLVIDDNETLVDMVKQYFSSHAVIEVRDVAYDGKDDLTLILTPSKSSLEYDDNYLEVMISKLLHELGVPSHIKGYTFIKEGINITF